MARDKKMSPRANHVNAEWVQAPTSFKWNLSQKGLKKKKKLHNLCDQATLQLTNLGDPYHCNNIYIDNALETC